jgi:hypothetical protein
MTGPAPSVTGTAAAATVRDARVNVAADILKSRQRISKISAELRAETAQLSQLLAIAEVVGVTDVEVSRAPDVVDASVDPSPSDIKPLKIAVI